MGGGRRRRAADVRGDVGAQLVVDRQRPPLPPRAAVCGASRKAWSCSAPWRRGTSALRRASEPRAGRRPGSLRAEAYASLEHESTNVKTTTRAGGAQADASRDHGVPGVPPRPTRGTRARRPRRRERRRRSSRRCSAAVRSFGPSVGATQSRAPTLWTSAAQPGRRGRRRTSSAGPMCIGFSAFAPRCSAAVRHESDLCAWRGTRRRARRRLASRARAPHRSTSQFLEVGRLAPRAQQPLGVAESAARRRAAPSHRRRGDGLVREPIASGLRRPTATRAYAARARAAARRKPCA